MNASLLLALMAPTDSGPSGMIILAIQMVALIAIFYFLLLRPQSQAKKKHAELLAAGGRECPHTARALAELDGYVPGASRRAGG